MSPKLSDTRLENAAFGARVQKIGFRLDPWATSMGLDPGALIYLFIILSHLPSSGPRVQTQELGKGLKLGAHG